MNWTTRSIGFTTLNGTEAQQIDSSGAATYTSGPLENLTLYFEPSSKYIISCTFLRSAAATATGVQMRFNTTGGPNRFLYTMTYYTSATAEAICQGTNTTSNACAATTSSGVIVAPAQYYGFIETSLNPAVFTAELATEVDLSAARIEEGSFCRAMRMS